MSDLRIQLQKRNSKHTLLWMKQKSIYATARFLQDALLSQRWRDRRFSGNLYETILKAEEKAHLQKKPKYVTLNNIDIELLPNHWNVLAHINHLRELMKAFPSTKPTSQINRLKKACIGHDLWEVLYLDRSQSEGKNKTTRKYEDIALFQSLKRLYTWDTYHEMMEIIHELEEKWDLYVSLKIYEEMSHIDGVLAMQKKWIWFEIDAIQFHIDNLNKYLARDPSYHKQIDRFLQKRKIIWKKFSSRIKESISKPRIRKWT